MVKGAQNSPLRILRRGENQANICARGLLARALLNVLSQVGRL